MNKELKILNKVIWINFKLSKPKIHFHFSITSPDEDDYFKKQYGLYFYFICVNLCLSIWENENEEN